MITKETPVRSNVKNTNLALTSPKVDNTVSESTPLRRQSSKLNTDRTVIASQGHKLTSNRISPKANLTQNTSTFSALSNRNFPVTKIPLLEFYELSTALYPSPYNPTTGDRLQKLQNQRKKSDYYVELESSFSFTSSKSLKGDNEAFIDYKEDREKSLRLNTHGINFIRNHRYLTYGLGLQLSKYTERVSYTVDKEAPGYLISYDTTYRVVNDNFNSGGSPVFLIEEQINEIRNPTTIIIDDQVIATNTFTRIQVPLFIGIQKSYKNWSAELRTSLSVNYLIEQNGIYINEDLQRIENLEDQSRFNSVTFSNRSDMSIGYALNEFFVVGGRFSNTLDLTSFTKDYDSKLRSKNLGVWIMWKPF